MTLWHEEGTGHGSLADTQSNSTHAGQYIYYLQLRDGLPWAQNIRGSIRASRLPKKGLIAPTFMPMGTKVLEP